MIFIEKGTEPKSFTEWKSLENADWVPTYDNLQNPEKAAVLNSLIAEQHGICCYCEQTVTENTSHIEHLIPQAVDPTKALDYGNMLCSCIKHTPPGTCLHCGHKRGNWYDGDYISPLENDCEMHFLFNWDGSIMPKDCTDSRAIHMIRNLALNHVVINEKRKAALDSLLVLSMTKEEMLVYAAAITKPDSNGLYHPGFPSMFRALVLGTSDL